MENSPATSPESQIIVEARFSELARLNRWVDELAAAHAIPSAAAFAIYLCLEELVANTIKHGHGGESSQPVKVGFSQLSSGGYRLVLENTAPPFNPLTLPPLPPLNARDEIRIGGQGLRLLREFSSSLIHEALPAGNRYFLTITA